MDRLGRVTVTELKNWFLETYGIYTETSMLCRAISHVRNEALGVKLGFGKLTSFLNELARSNADTTISVVSPGGVFIRAFLALGMCVQSFQHTTRVLGLDACHVKAAYGGVLLVMTAIDGNGQIYPCAIAIAEGENQTTWTWFLSLVKTAFRVGDGTGLVFLSDREKGIENGVADLFPGALHSFCVYHMQKNVKVKFKTALNGLLFRAATAANEREFLGAIDEMRTLHGAATRYVERINPEKWARAFFPSHRFGHVTSNISESMNWWLEEARRVDPVSLFSTYIRKLNGLFEKRRYKHSLPTTTDLPQKVHEMFTKCVDESRTLRVFVHTRAIVEVQRKNAPGLFRVVDLEAPTCSCGFYKEHGVPCRHMCAAIIFLKGRPQAFVVSERRLSSLQAVYAGTTIPVDLSNLHDDGMKPPTSTKRRGMPKVKRILSSAEKGPRQKVTCGLCGGKGHNVRTCKQQNK